MRRQWQWVFLGTIILAAGIFVSHGQPDLKTNTKDVMKFKLHYAQGVLEAIATENFPLLSTNAHKLKDLSQQADWMIRQTPEYQQLTTEFARTADSLIRAADNKNVDAATVAYFQMTASCVNCHQHLRGTREAKSNSPVQKENAAPKF